jgi:hypothetical protein
MSWGVDHKIICGHDSNHDEAQNHLVAINFMRFFQKKLVDAPASLKLKLGASISGGALKPNAIT